MVPTIYQKVLIVLMMSKHSENYLKYDVARRGRELAIWRSGNDIRCGY